MYTIQREIGRLENFHIGLIGDLANGRTVRSLAYVLSMYSNVKMYFVAPDVVGGEGGREGGVWSGGWQRGMVGRQCVAFVRICRDCSISPCLAPLLLCLPLPPHDACCSAA